jgi:hypothetical protein
MCCRNQHTIPLVVCSRGMQASVGKRRRKRGSCLRGCGKSFTCPRCSVACGRVSTNSYIYIHNSSPVSQHSPATPTYSPTHSLSSLSTRPLPIPHVDLGVPHPSLAQPSITILSYARSRREKPPSSLQHRSPPQPSSRPPSNSPTYTHTHSVNYHLVLRGATTSNRSTLTDAHAR